MVFVDMLPLDGWSSGGFLALILGALAFFFVILVVMWIYMALTFSAMARKARLKSPGLAWIPFVGPAIIAFQASKMHWWPWLLLVGMFLPVISGLASLAFMVFFVIWQWKLFEAIKRPGWWALLCLITPVNFVLWGIAAWGKK